MSAGRAVSVSSVPMALDEVVAVARGAAVDLAADALDSIAASRRVVDDAISRGEAVYGVTTGVGHARDERLPRDSLRALQPVLIEMHVGAMGPVLPVERVRAGLVARLSGFARGGAGVSVAVARGVADLLNHRIHPVIPARGSVGAGDVGQLALVGRVLLGRGEVEFGGRRCDAAEALDAAGLRPVTLEPKDALAIISSNALTIGHGALLVRRAEQLLALADLVVACSMVAVNANPSILDPAVARVRGSRGQQVVSERILGALPAAVPGGGQVAASVQDPLSFRVAPQVHGACLDVLAITADALSAELNAAADNPLVDVASGRVLSNGNFHPMNVALATESLRVALAHVGLLAERRLGHLWDAAVTSLGMPAASGGPPSEGGPPPVLAALGLRYPAAARYTRLRQLANPVTLDVPALDLGVEDHATNAAEALAMTDEALDIVEQLLITELLTAGIVLGPASSVSGRGTPQLIALLREEVGRAPVGTQPGDLHRLVTMAVRKRFDDGLAGPHGRTAGS